MQGKQSQFCFLLTGLSAVPLHTHRIIHCDQETHTENRTRQFLVEDLESECLRSTQQPCVCLTIMRKGKFSWSASNYDAFMSTVSYTVV